MDYQWYPGHMTKARRMMQENIKLVDLVIEIIDARIPFSSRNPDIDSLAAGKSRIIVMGKADLADPAITRQFQKEFESKGWYVVAVDSRTKKAGADVKGIVEKACQEKIERDRKRGILNRPLRAMVCGIPNVGKSTFINSLAGRASTKTGNKPGVTRGKQWISVKLNLPGQKGQGMQRSLDLLDTPGILWPKFDDRAVGVKLALAGSIREEILDEDELSLELLQYLIRMYPRELASKYSCHDLAWIPQEENLSQDQGIQIDSVVLHETLQQIAKNRNLLAKGEEPDLKRASHLLLDDFKNGRIGRITLDRLEKI